MEPLCGDRSVHAMNRCPVIATAWCRVQGDEK